MDSVTIFTLERGGILTPGNKSHQHDYQQLWCAPYQSTPRVKSEGRILQDQLGDINVFRRDIYSEFGYDFLSCFYQHYHLWTYLCANMRLDSASHE